MKTETFCLPGTDIGRSLVNIKKVKNTPKQYPRKAGIPSKNPLLIKQLRMFHVKHSQLFYS